MVLCSAWIAAALLQAPATGAVKAGQVVHADAQHWRIFLETPVDSKLKPSALAQVKGAWKSFGMSKITLKDKVVWETTIASQGDLSYAFWLESKRFKDGDQGQVLDADGVHATQQFKPLTAIAKDYPIPDNPRWASSTTIYRVEIDRFDREKGATLGSNGGEKRLGGNIRGVLKHSDYLVTLGLGTVLLSPLADSTDPFGRQVIQPPKLSPALGDAGDLNDLYTELHRNNLRVLAEGPELQNVPKPDGWVDPQPTEGWKVAAERPTWDVKSNSQTAILTDWFTALRKWIHDPDAKATDLAAQFQLQRDSIPDSIQDFVIHELGDQNGPRPSSEFRDLPRLKQAFALLFTYPGVPLVRAGDEIALTGGAFPDNREPMPWNPGTEDASLQNFVKLLIAMRTNRPSLWRGSYEPLIENDEIGLFGFVRRDRFQTTLCIVNNSDLTASWSAAAGRFGDNLSDLIGGASMGVVNGVLSLSVSPHSFAIIGTP